MGGAMDWLQADLSWQCVIGIIIGSFIAMFVLMAIGYAWNFRSSMLGTPRERQEGPKANQKEWELANKGKRTTKSADQLEVEEWARCQADLFDHMIGVEWREARQAIRLVGDNLLPALHRRNAQLRPELYGTDRATVPLDKKARAAIEEQLRLVMMAENNCLRLYKACKALIETETAESASAQIIKLIKEHARQVNELTE